MGQVDAVQQTCESPGVPLALCLPVLDSHLGLDLKPGSARRKVASDLHA